MKIMSTITMMIKIIAMILFFSIILENVVERLSQLLSYSCLFSSHHAYLAICEFYFGLSFES